MDVWVGRCSCGAQTLTLFKIEISDFPTMFMTAPRFLRPCLNTFEGVHGKKLFLVTSD